MSDTPSPDSRAAAVASTLDGLEPLRSRVESLVAGRRHVLFVARGSSENATTYGCYLVQTEAHLPAAIGQPSICTHYHARIDLSDTVVVAVSTSGTTAEVVETQAWAAKAGARTIALTDDPASPLGRGADAVLTTEPDLTPEASAGSYASQLAAVAWMVSALPGVDPRLAEQLSETPAEIARRQRTALDLAPAVAALHSSSQVYVASRGICLGSAEAAARLLQLRWGHPVVALSYADLRHGPLGAVDADTVVVAMAASDGPLVAGLTEMSGTITGRGAVVVGIGGDEAFRDSCTHALPGTDLNEELAPVGLVVPVQRLASALAG